jgi:cell division protein FtsB
MKVIDTISLVISVMVLLYICSIGIKNIIRYNGFELEYQLLLSQINSETQKNRAYKKQLISLKEDVYWEMEAKNRLGFVRPGEQIYRMAK